MGKLLEFLNSNLESKSLTEEEMMVASLLLTAYSLGEELGSNALDVKEQFAKLDKSFEIYMECKYRKSDNINKN